MTSIDLNPVPYSLFKFIFYVLLDIILKKFIFFTVQCPYNRNLVK